MVKTAPDAERDIPTLSETEGVRYLHFDSPWIQGAMQISHPSRLVFLYTRQMMGWLLFLGTSAVKRIDILGLGAGSLTRYCLRHTKAQIHCVEWNPSVTAFCHQYFKLPYTHQRLSITHADAQQWVADTRHHGTSQVLLVDLYDYTAQGPVADSLEFYENCYHILGDYGILVVNLFGHHPSFRKNIKHIREAFQQRVLMFDETEDGNRIVLAFKGPRLMVDCENFLKRARVVERHSELEAVTMAEQLLPQLKKNARQYKVSPNLLLI